MYSGCAVKFRSGETGMDKTLGKKLTAMIKCLPPVFESEKQF